ncbi:MAG: DUF2399 domain-containing protein [Pseudonocardiaceae bacterium]
MTTAPAATVALSARAARIGDLLGDRKTRRVPLRELWRILDQADPTLGTDSRRRALLAAALRELATAGVLDLPSDRSFDQTEAPPLPRFVTLPACGPPPVQRRAVVWHPALAWAADARLTVAQYGTVEAVNAWLYQHRDELVVPLRERSLDIFGHEKVLDRLLGTSLFSPGRLSLTLLRTRRATVHFTSEVVGAGSLLLIVENSDTYDSVLRALANRHDHRVGIVGWGAGAAFEASVLSIPRLGRPVSAIAYFGDLDEKGLRIPSNAATLAQREGLPMLRPATGLYAALCRLATPQSSPRKTQHATASTITAWLDPAHQARAARHLVAGERLAQEAVGLAHLLRHDDWLSDLRR